MTLAPSNEATEIASASGAAVMVGAAEVWMTSMALMNGLLAVPFTKSTSIRPSLVTGSSAMVARWSPPARATTSTLVSLVAPSTATLKIRLPTWFVCFDWFAQ